MENNNTEAANMNILSGFIDEAGSSIDDQIKVIKEMRWSHIEARAVNGKNLTDISNDEFEEVCEKVNSAGIKIHCFGSAVANGGKDPYSEDDYNYSIEALKRAIPRMHRLGTKLIRGMSFKGVSGLYENKLSCDSELEKIVFEKVKRIAEICEDGGVVYGLENCGDYTNHSWQHARKLYSTINSPSLKMIFDMGNLVGAIDRTSSDTNKVIDIWDYYTNIKDLIHHVHIKDSYMNEEGKKVHTFPGEGNALVEKIVKDLLASGYNGCFSIEPHMYNGPEGFKEYGKKFEAILEKIKKNM